ncbi:MAG: N-acetyl-gamma-glutamyl-phosphate reductase, partial [Dehalococcoidia bacterium]|nr:N-acetyl-gamma-glutamyl-phosphate reductase [Dehalococcoidia bacterium]
LDGHRHLPEIVQELQRLSNSPLSVTFVPHLIPMTRGILSTCYARLKGDSGSRAKERVRELYEDFYRDESFVKVTGSPPQTKQTWGSNFCLVYPVVDSRTGRLVVVSCIDNLVKGGAGQAVQNMNLMLGLPEVTGLAGLPLYP